MDYVVTCMIGLVFIYGYNLVSAILRGMGDSRHPFLFIAIASVLNAILDVVFVVSWDMEVFGAALATVIGQAVSFLCALMILYRRRAEFLFDFRPKSFRITRDTLLPLISLGIPMSIQSAAVSISRVYVNSWVNSYGVIASAVSGMGHKTGDVQQHHCPWFYNSGVLHGGTVHWCKKIQESHRSDPDAPGDQWCCQRRIYPVYGLLASGGFWDLPQRAGGAGYGGDLCARGGGLLYWLDHPAVHAFTD